MRSRSRNLVKEAVVIVQFLAFAAFLAIVHLHSKSVSMSTELFCDEMKAIPLLLFWGGKEVQ